MLDTKIHTSPSTLHSICFCYDRARLCESNYMYMAVPRSMQLHSIYRSCGFLQPALDKTSPRCLPSLLVQLQLLPNQHTMAIEHPKNVNTEEVVSEVDDPAVLVRYRKRPILLLVYIPLLVVPWILTCILVMRPLTAASYILQQDGLTSSQIEDISRTYLAVRSLNAIASVLTIPVVGAVLAQAAVVYSQRRHPNQSLSIRQVLVLADKSWLDIATIIDALRSKSGTSSLFFWLASALAFISKLQS